MPSRRDFIAQAATTAAALTAAACAGHAAPVTAAAPAVPPVPPAPTHWDDSWTQRVAAARHKAVFDSPEVKEGMALGQAITYRHGYHDALGTTDADVVPVIVMRHRGTVMAMNDHLWDRYELGKYVKVKDETTGKWARRNPFLHGGGDDFPASASLQALNDSGVVLLACGRAIAGMAQEMAEKTKQDPETVRAEILANLVPGALAQPSGVYATIRAQEVGCVFMRSS